MRPLFHLSFLLLLACGLAGCFDNRPITRVDGGPVVVPRDGGPIDPPMDSGGIILQDSGPICVPESTASACTDFADNDCDLAIDCNDISCCSAVTCATGTLCGNMRVDAGVDAGRDSGPTSCPGVNFPTTLSSSCLPRCSSSTLTAWGACAAGDSACVVDALEADTTPSINTTVNGEPRTLDCIACVGYQQNTCAYTYCPDAYAAYATCGGTRALCPSEAAALDACIDASTGFQDCASTQIERCFP